MKRMKLWAIAILIMGILAGCSVIGAKSHANEKPKVIVVWNYYNGAQKAAFDALVQKFNETEGANHNIVIDSVSKGAIPELTQALQDSMQKKVGSDPLPQIYAAYADTAYAINEEGLVVDIGDYMTSEEMAEYVDAYVEEGQFKESDKLKLFPVAKSTEVLIINMTDWNKFAAATGVNTDSLSTWEGIAEVAEQYYNWSGGKAFFGRDAFANYMLIGSSQLGHEIFKVNDGNATLDYDKATIKKLWDCYYIPYIKGYYTADGKFRSDDLKTGNLIALIGSTSGVAYTPSAVTFEDGTSYEIECRIFPLPGFKGEKPCAVQQGAGMMVLKSDPELEKASVAFLKWFTEEQQNLEFCLASGYLPVKKSANEDQVFFAALEHESENISDIMQQCFKLGIKAVREYDLYTTKSFPEANQGRNLLDEGMSARAAEDRAALEELIAGGMERELALEQFTSEENFEAWYQESYEKLLLLGE